jgi:short-subunit dehydrogenase
VRMTRAFLPVLKRSPKARIVNISSIFGIISPPGQAAYSASKFAVRGFSNALRHELEITGSRIGVTVVHPGGVATNIAESARSAAGMSEADIRTSKEMARKLPSCRPRRPAKSLPMASSASCRVSWSAPTPRCWPCWSGWSL